MVFEPVWTNFVVALLSEIKFFTVEDLCRFWHLWTDFNYANVPLLLLSFSRKINWLTATFWIDLHYLYTSHVWFGYSQFRDLHFLFFLWLWCFVTWCYLSNLTTKSASSNPHPFFPDACPLWDEGQRLNVFVPRI